MAARAAFGALLLAAVCTLTGCDAPGQEGIQDWITQQRAQARPAVMPIPESKVFSPQAYAADTALDPFNSQKLTQALRREASGTGTPALLIPEQARARQPLEAYPLESMAYVGSLARRGAPVALIKVDRWVHRVGLGAYLGQNYGKVIQINETHVLLREIVQDASGEWTERTASLPLHQNKP